MRSDPHPGLHDVVGYRSRLVLTDNTQRITPKYPLPSASPAGRSVQGIKGIILTSPSTAQSSVLDLTIDRLMIFAVTTAMYGCLATVCAHAWWGRWHYRIASSGRHDASLITCVGLYRCIALLTASGAKVVRSISACTPFAFSIAQSFVATVLMPVFIAL